MTGTPDRDDTAIAAVDTGAQRGRKWPPEPTTRHAVRQGVRIRVFENSDPSEQVGMVWSDGADRHFHLICEGCMAVRAGPPPPAPPPPPRRAGPAPHIAVSAGPPPPAPLPPPPRASPAPPARAAPRERSYGGAPWRAAARGGHVGPPVWACRPAGRRVGAVAAAADAPALR